MEKRKAPGMGFFGPGDSAGALPRAEAEESSQGSSVLSDSYLLILESSDSRTVARTGNWFVPREKLLEKMVSLRSLVGRAVGQWKRKEGC